MTLVYHIFTSFFTYNYCLDLVRILDFLSQYIYHVLGFFICGLAMSLLVVGAGASLEHANGAYLVVL